MASFVDVRIRYYTSIIALDMATLQAVQNRDTGPMIIATLENKSHVMEQYISEVPDLLGISEDNE